MYCSKCFRQSPDNFTSCAYCGAPFKTKKKQTAQRFKVKKQRLPFFTSGKKSALTVLIAAIIVLVSVLTGILTGSKPGSVIKRSVSATVAADTKEYVSIYDGYYIDYCTQNKYYDDSATFKALSDAMIKSNDFYTKTCGEGYKLSYRVKSTEYFDENALAELNDALALNYAYPKKAKAAAELYVEVTAKGDKGEYTTVYKDYVCIKLGGKWYKSDLYDKMP